MRLNATLILAATAALGLATMTSAQQRLPRECRQEIRQLCGTDRSKIRECLQTQFTDLSGTCQDEVWQRVETNLKANRKRNARIYDRTAQMAPTTSLEFGQDERQQVDFYAAQASTTDRPALVFFVHGGGWSIGTRKAVQFKPLHFTQQGYAFASTGYRLLPDAPVEEQARDVGRALETVFEQADTLGFDHNRIIIMGHSAGAHLAALVSTDPQYAGAAFEAIQGAVLLDGAGYDIEAQLDDRARMELPGLYKRVFGDDPERHRALSPIEHIGGPDVANWLILHVADRAISTRRSTEFGAALEVAGHTADVVAIEDTDHGRMNRELGEDNNAQTLAVDAFVREVLD